jgi:hypothetical protein
MIRACFWSSSRSVSSSGKKNTPKGQSSHRKERKDAALAVRAAAGAVATTASGDAPTASPPESHRVICKAGNYVCPLCGLGFKLNQTYGNHVKAKECKVSNPSLQLRMSHNQCCGSSIFCQCGSGSRAGSGSRSKVLMTKHWKKITAEIKFVFF